MPRLTDALVGSFSEARHALVTRLDGGETATGSAEADGGTLDADPAADARRADGTEGSPAPHAADSSDLLYGPEAVVGLLDDAGGRLWQGELVEQMEVSASTVSRWLYGLEEADRIERLRIGRENLVMLPGNYPELAESSLPPRPDEGR